MGGDQEPAPGPEDPVKRGRWRRWRHSTHAVARCVYCQLEVLGRHGTDIDQNQHRRPRPQGSGQIIVSSFSKGFQTTRFAASRPRFDEYRPVRKSETPAGPRIDRPGHRFPSRVFRARIHLGDRNSMTQPAESNKPNYEAPTVEVVGTLHDLTKGGDVPINELANQPNVNNDAFPVVAS